MSNDMQQSLYHETLQDALGDVVRALGGPKHVGALLWPEKGAEDAGRLLRHCLLADRPEKLSLEQLALLLRMGREKGVHAPMTFLCRDAGYQDPIAVEPADERAQLMRDFVEAQRALAGMAKRMERAGLLQVVA